MAKKSAAKAQAKTPAKKQASKEPTVYDRAIRAVSALQKYVDSKNDEESTKAQLFDDNEEHPIYVSITGKKYFGEERKLKPKLIPVKNSIWGSKTPKTLIFVKDPQRKYKDVLQAEDKKIVDRVVGVTKLKGKFKPYEARRALKNEYDIILGQEEVIPMLPKLLGKAFYGSLASVPLSVRFARKDQISAEAAQKQLDNILGSTWYTLPGSTKLSIRVGTSGQKPEEVAENVKAVVEHFTGGVVDGLEALRTITLKTADSPALPVYETTQLYTEEDIGTADAAKGESESAKRKREDKELDALLAEVADEEEIVEYNKNELKRRKTKGKQAKDTSKGKPESEAEPEAEHAEQKPESEAEQSEQEPESEGESASEQEPESESDSGSEFDVSADSDESLDE